MTKPENGSAGVVLAAISFYPDISGTGHILTDLAESLAEGGMEVHVYTAQPHYYQKNGKFPAREFHKGIQITRLRSTTFDKNFRFGRVLNWLSFTWSAFWALLFEKTDFPYLLVSSPPVLPFAGWILKKLRKKPFLALVHDVYPDIGVRLDFFRKKGPTVKIWNLANRLTFGAADRIIVLSEDMAGIMRKKTNARSEKITVVHNWADGDLIRPLEKTENLFLKETGVSHPFLVQYAGNLGFNHDLELLIEAARRFSSKDIGFIFIGEGGKKEKLRNLARSCNLENVSFFPFQPRSRLAHTLGAADLSVVTLEKGTEGLAVPSKFYSILASGRAVLAILGNRCEMARLVEKYQCGFVARDGNAEEIVRILEQCLNHPEPLKQMGRNARICFEENFTREKAVKSYRSLLAGLQPNSRKVIPSLSRTTT